MLTATRPHQNAAQVPGRSLGDVVRAAALAQVAAEAGATPVLMHQVHGSDVSDVDASAAGAAPSGLHWSLRPS